MRSRGLRQAKGIDFFGVCAARGTNQVKKKILKKPNKTKRLSKRKGSL